MKLLRRIFWIFIIILVSVFSFKSYNSIDGILGGAYGLFFSNETRYSSRYSDDKFKAITIGMKRQEVVDVLGEPLSVYQIDTNSIYLRFSETTKGPGREFRVRGVDIDHDTVKEKYAFFYVGD